MFFKQVWRNAAKSRKNNGLFFGSLVIAIVAFYTLLSLENQDVMLFLKTVESDAVSKLMLMIPVVYIVSLFFVFFLVYFAYQYQLNNRKKELGLYIMVGMKRIKLFAMLMSETFWNSIVSTLIGLPIAWFLTEIISLTSAKLVGLGIIGHKVSFSSSAVLYTVAGFILIQMIAMLFLCIKFSRKEPMQLLHSDSPDKHVFLSKKKGWFCFIVGILCLIMAYICGILLLQTFNIKITAFILLSGGAGTFLLYYGIGAFIGQRIQKASVSQSGLFFFTGRQIQENVLHQHKALAISSLLLLIALTCAAFGIGIASGRGAIESRVVDFSIEGTEQEIGKVLDTKANKELISTYYPMFVSSMDREIHKFSLEGLKAGILAQSQTDLRDNMIENIDKSSDYIISEASYNDLLQSIGKKPIELRKNELAMYTSNRDNSDFINILNRALKSDAYIQVDDQKYELLPDLYYDNIVADRKITIYLAFIVSDEDYENWADDSSEPLCWNIRLSGKTVEEKGLMQAIRQMEQNLAETGLEYESYLGGIGRNLFYTVTASYITIYIGVLFMLIANTVMGLKFLMQQRANRHRYITLLMLGATTKELCSSAKKQIQLFFVLVLGVAVCSSIFTIWAMFTSFMKLPAGVSAIRVFLLAGIGFLLFILIEIIYIIIVERVSRREIHSMRVTDRR